MRHRRIVEMEHSTQRYALMVKAKLAHAPIQPSSAEERSMVEKLKRHERIKPELLAIAAHLGKHVEFHPIRVEDGEKLPEGLEHNSTRILINTKAIRVFLDKEKISKEMESLQRRVAIAYFVDGNIFARAMQRWISALSKKLNEECRIDRDLSHGNFHVVVWEEVALQKALMLTSLLSGWSIAFNLRNPWVPAFNRRQPRVPAFNLRQPWVPTFNSRNPQGLRISVWITLKSVLEEFPSSAWDMTKNIGILLG